MKLIEITRPTNRTTRFCTTIRSRWAMDWKISLAKTRKIKDVLDNDCASEQERKLQPHDGDDGNQGVSKRMAPKGSAVLVRPLARAVRI